MKSVYLVVTQGTGGSPKVDLVLSQPSGGFSAETIAVDGAIAANTDPSPAALSSQLIGNVDIDSTSGGVGDTSLFAVGSLDSGGTPPTANILAHGHQKGHPAYNSGTTYAINDPVDDGLHSYRSLQNANTGHTPASSPTWWELGYSCAY